MVKRTRQVPATVPQVALAQEETERERLQLELEPLAPMLSSGFCGAKKNWAGDIGVLFSLLFFFFET